MRSQIDVGTRVPASLELGASRTFAARGTIAVVLGHQKIALISYARAAALGREPSSEPGLICTTSGGRPLAPIDPWPSRLRSPAIACSSPHRVRHRRAAQRGPSGSLDKARWFCRSKDRDAPAGTPASPRGIGILSRPAGLKRLQPLLRPSTIWRHLSLCRADCCHRLHTVVKMIRAALEASREMQYLLPGTGKPARPRRLTQLARRSLDNARRRVRLAPAS